MGYGVLNPVAALLWQLKNHQTDWKKIFNDSIVASYQPYWDTLLVKYVL